MSRLLLPDPEPIIFTLELEVTQDYINAAKHVANQSYVILFNKAAEAFFESRGVHPYTVNQQVLMNTEFSVQIKSEVRLSDKISIVIGVDNFHRCGCDFIYRMSNSITHDLLARARFSYLCFDYQAGRLVDATQGFRRFFTGAESDEPIRRN